MNSIPALRHRTGLAAGETGATSTAASQSALSSCAALATDANTLWGPDRSADLLRSSTTGSTNARRSTLASSGAGGYWVPARAALPGRPGLPGTPVLSRLSFLQLGLARRGTSRQRATTRSAGTGIADTAASSTIATISATTGTPSTSSTVFAPAPTIRVS